MKMITKKLLALVISAVLTVSSLPVAFAADNSIVISGNAGEKVSWVLTKDGVLTVSGTGPIEDKTEVEYDEDGTSCTSTIDSISMTFLRYFDEETADSGAAEKARARFDLVKEIVVEEGITDIPHDEFSGMFPAKVTLPSTLEILGYDAFDLMFAEGITVSSIKLSELDIYVPAYESDAEPYKSLSEAKENYIKRAEAQEEFEFDLLPFDALFNYAYVTMLPDEAGWYGMSDEGRQEMMDIYNQYLGTEAKNLEEIVPAALKKLNELYGTTYTSTEEIFTLETDEDGNSNIVTEPELQEIIDAKNEELYYDRSLTVKDLDFDESRIAYDWFTVNGPAGGKIEEDCKAAGVNFKALDNITEPEENENLCKFCGEEHTGNWWQNVIGFFHNILYFFAHLFGIM